MTAEWRLVLCPQCYKAAGFKRPLAEVTPGSGLVRRCCRYCSHWWIIDLETGAVERVTLRGQGLDNAKGGM